MARATLTGLPEEILLQILSLLEPPELTRLQLTSRVLRSLARDDNLWRARCFDQSLFLETLDRRRRIHALIENEKGQDPLPQPGFPLGLGHNGSIFGGESEDHESRKRERVRIMANWDPSYPSEKVSWYDEYIQRHAPIAVSWLQQPQIRDGSLADVIEARGLALYRPNRSPEQNGTRDVLYAVSPLDDGSVCLWDVNGTEGRRGAVVSKSRPGILFIDGPSADNSRRSKRVDSGVTECVAVDSVRHRAYFAVQSRMYQNPQHPTTPSCTPLTRGLGPDLIEVDLQRLSVVGCESFPWSITALSTAHHNLPLTVGTSLGIHMHDFRAPSSLAPDPRDGIDEFDVTGAQEYYERSLRVIFDDDPLPPYAPLSQPGPLSILHLQRPGAEADISDDVFVAGRFSNILHYDRRKFPSIQGSIHSGARLCAMTSLPFPYSTVDSELRRAGQLSVNKVAKSKSMTGGRTLIACGEYNTKGSLELYGLSPSSEASTMAAGGLQQSTLKNRQTSSQSKLLSVANHGTRLVFSDGSGLIKWFERDGCTEVRRHRIGHCEGAQGPSLFASMPGSDDIARKILCTSSGVDNGRVNDNDLLFWTGEKLGLVGFSSQPGFKADDFEEVVKTAEEEAREAEERQYHDRMRQALERQADDVRLVTNLGFGTSV